MLMHPAERYKKRTSEWHEELMRKDHRTEEQLVRQDMYWLVRQ